ncbi:cytochrome P450 monooxygenase [Rhodofomes roseus]|uniref:Cytochrome P450 monooxygenase n=1 Tax=Rhodofomes roseus TaxID=34475 RepID=A0ABQ8KG95_9APHY|nr:cytochrome P450 monooxygenase [Rhodofomes roseus]KAH9836267.1 cytochrome P450 monooxygenase [Rhodofomes roseus]
MSPTTLSSVASFSVIALAAYCFFRYFQWGNRCTRSLPLPPGPRPIPLLGNVHQLPMDFPYLQFRKWGQMFGDVFCLKVFRRPTLVINSIHVAKELLAHRGAKYSDRFSSHLITVMGFEVATAFLGYGDTWRRHRKLMQVGLGDQDALARLRPVQQREIVGLLSRLSQDPDAFDSHLKHFTAALIMGSAYGETEDENILRYAETILHTLVTVITTPTAVVLDFLPFSKYVPSWVLSGLFNAGLLKTRPLLVHVMDSAFEDARTRTAAALGKDKASFVAIATEAQTLKSDTNSDNDIKVAAFTMFIGQSNSRSFSAITLNSFLVQMVTHQDVYAKAQRSIDEVVGKERLPDLSDRNSLPYVDAILKEVYRLINLGIPRRLMDDDEYRGYHIPKGTSVIANIWQMGRDSNYYKDPDTFNPDRFIDPKPGSLVELDPREYIFSFGRRICPGQRFGDDSMWWTIASIIATFNVKKALDADGKKITPSMTVLPGLTSHIQQFPCSIQPRSQRALELIAESAIHLE